MNITQRQVILGLFAMQLVATLLILAGQIQVDGIATARTPQDALADQARTVS